MNDLIKTAKKIIDDAENLNAWGRGERSPDVTALCKLLLEYHEALTVVQKYNDTVHAKFAIPRTYMSKVTEALAAAGKGGEAG